jgi:hypothetical protein
MADAGLSSDPRGLLKACAQQNSRKSARRPGVEPVPIQTSSLPKKMLLKSRISGKHNNFVLRQVEENDD